MIISQEIINEAKRRGDSNKAGQYVPEGGRPISSDEVVELLVNSISPRAQPGARVLLREMSACPLKTPWTVQATIHPSKNDATPHILVDVIKNRYHLRLDAQKRVFDITATASDGKRYRPSGRKPWVPPGA